MCVKRRFVICLTGTGSQWIPSVALLNSKEYRPWLKIQTEELAPFRSMDYFNMLDEEEGKMLYVICVVKLCNLPLKHLAKLRFTRFK
jgi:hypothetical protein